MTIINISQPLFFKIFSIEFKNTHSYQILLFQGKLNKVRNTDDFLKENLGSRQTKLCLPPRPVRVNIFALHAAPAHPLFCIPNKILLRFRLTFKVYYLVYQISFMYEQLRCTKFVWIYRFYTDNLNLASYFIFSDRAYLAKFYKSGLLIGIEKLEFNFPFDKNEEGLISRSSIKYSE